MAILLSLNIENDPLIKWKRAGMRMHLFHTCPRLLKASPFKPGTFRSSRKRHQFTFLARELISLKRWGSR